MPLRLNHLIDTKYGSYGGAMVFKSKISLSKVVEKKENKKSTTLLLESTSGIGPLLGPDGRQIYKPLTYNILRATSQTRFGAKNSGFAAPPLCRRTSRMPAPERQASVFSRGNLERVANHCAIHSWTYCGLQCHPPEWRLCRRPGAPAKRRQSIAWGQRKQLRPGHHRPARLKPCSLPFTVAHPFDLFTRLIL